MIQLSEVRHGWAFGEVTHNEETHLLPTLPCPPPGIDLENIVYYKDDTHYFVMTAKKQCLLRLGVLRQVGPGPGREGLGGGPWEVEARPGHSLPPTPTRCGQSLSSPAFALTFPPLQQAPLPWDFHGNLNHILG